MSTLAAVSPQTLFTAALRGATCGVLGGGYDGGVLPVERWQRCADDSDGALLANCVGPTLDVGCGPGRMSRHLMEQGIASLGIDLVAEAVEQARRRGVPALVLDVFGPLPGIGRWETVLLADGNIGIGGDPARLLRRCRTLLAPGGRVVADLAVPGTGVRSNLVRLVSASHRSHPFRWSEVGPESVTGLAAAADLDVVTVTDLSGRWFAVMRRRP